LTTLYNRHKIPKNSHPSLWRKEEFSQLWLKYSIEELTKMLHVSHKAVEKAVKRFGLTGLKDRGFKHEGRRWGPGPPPLGEKRLTKDGYVLIFTIDGWQLEHRHIIESKLGRSLLPSEFVHHINGIKSDNRLENLQVLNRTDHLIRTRVCRDCELRKEIRLLRFQIRELRRQSQPSLFGGDE